MFETSVQENTAGVPWGILAALLAFFVLLGSGYLLIT